MTVAELIAELSKLPQDIQVYRACGGDCPGYTALDSPQLVTLAPYCDAGSYRGDCDTTDCEAAVDLTNQFKAIVF